MPRYFADADQIGQSQIVLTGPDVNHIKNVLRMAPGDDLTVSDGEGTDYFGHISSLSKTEVVVDIVDSWASAVELPVRVTLFQGLPKSDKMDLIIQKCVELGIYRIVPVSMKRSIVKLDAKKEAKRLERWRGISRSAAMQAGRGIIPEISECLTYKEALAMAKDLDAVLLPYEKAEGMDSARAAMKGLHGVSSVGVFIGPEGGFDEQEVEQALSMGAKAITLGHRILRTETAGMAVMSILMFELEED